MLPAILGIIGEKCSGKSSVFEYLRSKRGVYSARTSSVLQSILQILGLDETERRNEAKLAEALRATFGADILPRALMADPKAKTVPVVVLEGMRRLAELRPLMKMRNFRLLYVTAPIAIRWQRARGRRRNVRTDDRVSLARYRQIERTLITERDIPRMGKLADYRIENTGTKGQLFGRVDDILAELR